MGSKKHRKTYGEEKYYDMSRSILPSVARVKARYDKKQWASRRRSAIRNDISLFRGIPVEDAIEFASDEWESKRAERTRAHVRSRMQWDVSDRRAADKLAHFEHWAQRITKDIPEEEQLDYMKQHLPVSGIIGDHAMSHLKNVIGPRINYRSWLLDYEEKRSEREAEARMFFENALRKILELGLHKTFNKLVSRQHTIIWHRKKKEHEIVPLIRKFRGLHDIDAYVDEIMNAKRNKYGYRIYEGYIYLEKNPIAMLLRELLY